MVNSFLKKFSQNIFLWKKPQQGYQNLGSPIFAKLPTPLSIFVQFCLTPQPPLKSDIIYIQSGPSMMSWVNPHYGRTESFPFPFLSQGNFGKIWKETFPRIFKSFPRFGKRFTKPFLLLLKPFPVDKWKKAFPDCKSFPKLSLILKAFLEIQSNWKNLSCILQTVYHLQQQPIFVHMS